MLLSECQLCGERKASDCHSGTDEPTHRNSPSLDPVLQTGFASRYPYTSIRRTTPVHLARASNAYELSVASRTFARCRRQLFTQKGSSVNVKKVYKVVRTQCQAVSDGQKEPDCPRARGKNPRLNLVAAFRSCRKSAFFPFCRMCGRRKPDLIMSASPVVRAGPVRREAFSPPPTSLLRRGAPMRIDAA